MMNAIAVLTAQLTEAGLSPERAERCARSATLEDLTPEQLQGLTMHYVKSIPELLEVALPTSRAEVQHDAEIREQVLTGVPVA